MRDYFRTHSVSFDSCAKVEQELVSSLKFQVSSFPWRNMKGKYVRYALVA